MHPQGLCDSVLVGEGTRIWAGAQVHAGVRIGRNCSIGGGSVVEPGAVLGDRVTVMNQVLICEDVRIEDRVFLGPGVIFSKALRRPSPARSRPGRPQTRVGDGAILGADVVVLGGVTVGRHAFASAGAVLAADVPDHALVAGNPATQRGWVCACGLRLNQTLRCTCGRRYLGSVFGVIEVGPVPAQWRAAAVVAGPEAGTAEGVR